jgi:hypothetical protein
MNICNESRTPTLPLPFVCKEEGKNRFMIFNTNYWLWCESGGSDVTGPMDRVGDGSRSPANQPGGVEIGGMRVLEATG